MTRTYPDGEMTGAPPNESPSSSIMPLWRAEELLVGSSIWVTMKSVKTAISDVPIVKLCADRSDRILSAALAKVSSV